MSPHKDQTQFHYLEVLFSQLDFLKTLEEEKTLTIRC